MAKDENEDNRADCPVCGLAVTITAKGCYRRHRQCPMGGLPEDAPPPAAMSYTPIRGCGKHGTTVDHSRFVSLGADGLPMLGYHAPGPQISTGSVKVWKCTDCGHEERWGANWRVWGVAECLDCGYEGVDRVNCGCLPMIGASTP